MPHNKLIKKLFSRRFGLLVIASIVVMSATIVGTSYISRAQAANTLPAEGYAWSQYMGWIQFNGSNYGVLENVSTGDLSGYAWSPNLGWIKFLSSATVGPTGKLSGYAQACSAFANPTACSGALNTNSAGLDGTGWNGLISLSGTASDGTSYGVQQGSTCEWTGYAWGSDAIGAVSMSGDTYGVRIVNPALTVSLSASPTSISAGKTSTLTWSSTDTSSCTIDNGVNTANQTSGSVSVTPANTTTYTLTCVSNQTLKGGCQPTATAEATVTVGGASALSCTQTGSNYTATSGYGTYSWTVDNVASSITTNSVPIPTSNGSHSASVVAGGNTATCPIVIVGGTTSSNSCQINPTGTITATPNRVSSSAIPIEIAWSVQGYNTLSEFKAADCGIYKNNVIVKSLTDASVDTCNATGTYTDSNGIKEQTDYSVRCTKANGGASLADVIVNIQPQFTEF
ncbi:hypothetical protein MNBD_CPR01-119 [hydrothermal vent metagenome]|uniref:Ig-like domain-containing protein n=1 Tax=hydrothermal vent metagenome TaxID=652676 RepID=A0A3B0UMV9_9ZZZZ